MSEVPEQQEAAAYVARATSFRLKREVAVSWFDLTQLLATAGKTIAATIVGSMSGRRELMAALDPLDCKGQGEDLDFSERDVFWMDYLADTGDGWNATTSVAWLVGRDAIRLKRNCKATPQPIPESQDELGLEEDGEYLLLERGELLVTGGDEVYPTASPEAYQSRFNAPFACSRYSQTPPRSVLAIPGNHDWYDGLTSFIRLFCQKGAARRWIGAWQARQKRSYFAAKLPHGWWLWGTDTALGEDLDPPQYDFFRDAASRITDGERVILCIPGPHWVMAERDSAPDDLLERQLENKLRIIVELAESQGRSRTLGGRPNKAVVALILTGDLHYYARFQGEEEKQADNSTCQRHYLICGGGGAFGLGTVNVPKEIFVGDRSADRVDESLFPSKKESKKLRRGVWRFPLRNPGFTAVLVAVQIIALWLVHTVRPVKGWEGTWIDYAMSLPASFAGLGDFLLRVANAALYPALFLGTAVMLACFAAFSISGKPRGMKGGTAAVVGVLHAVIQISGSVSIVWLASQLVGASLGQTLLADAGAWFVVGLSCGAQFLLCGVMFGGYLFFSHKFLRMHDQEVFSAQGIEDFRSFLRIRITKEALTIFPIGLRDVARKWKAAPDVKATRRNGKPVDDGRLGWDVELSTPEGCVRIVDPATPLAPHLIEEQIVIGEQSCRDA